MGKKATWILAIRRLVACNSNEGHKKSRKGRGRLKRGSFFPFFREPSSIEEILGEIDQHNAYVPTTQSQPQPPPPPPPSPPPQTQTQSQSQSPPQQPPPQPRSQPQPPKAQAQPSSSSSRRHVSPPPPPPPPKRLTSPPKVSHTPEPTLQQHHLSATRIQAVYRGYTARKSTRNLTGLGRLQKVVTSISVKRQTVNAMKQMQLLIRVQTQIQSRRVQMLENQALKPQPDNNSQKQSEEHWDDSLITKEEREARLQRKADALIKRERAMAYAYSHQLSKGTPTATHKIPWWWKWLQHQLPYHTTTTLKNHQFATTPSRPTHKQLDRPTTPMSSSSTNRFTKARKAASLYSMKDDDSLRSCPPFSAPHYTSPTASTRAKARPTSNPKERCGTPTTPGSCSDTSKRRFSFPFTPNSARSVGDFSMDSSLGRKPFNRFV
ncbi:protein IQ-DOMAIN 13-like [Bidens hawaiensis]|uniref:protein IQ-DOMAIN 13-like n=1 Tax=Bidens hawaiensis TaxID=980011 RepID=UPI0040498E99